MQERSKTFAGSQEKLAAPEQAISAEFPACARAGRSRSKISGKRDCRLFDKLRWVDEATCAACPLAGLLADAAKDAEAALLVAKPKKTKTGKGKGRAATKGQPDLRCVHRGDVVRVELCKLCGNKEKPVDVHACAIHGECTLHRYAVGQKPATCLTCQDRVPELIQLGS